MSLWNSSSRALSSLVIAARLKLIQDADFASQRADVLDDGPRLRLPNGKLIFRRIELLDHLDERFHGERIVLRGYAEFLFQRAAGAVFFHQQLVLVVDLSGVGNELHAVVGERNAAAAAVKDRDAKLFFQLLHRAGQGRLRDVENFGRLIERPDFGYDDRVMKLLQCHLAHLPFCTGV